MKCITTLKAMPITSRLFSYFTRIKFVASFRSFISIASCLALNTSLFLIYSMSRIPPSNLDHVEPLKLPSISHENDNLLLVYNSSENPFRNLTDQFGSLEQTRRVVTDSPQVLSRHLGLNGMLFVLKLR